MQSLYDRPRQPRRPGRDATDGFGGIGMNNNDKIKEAFEKWANSEFTQAEIDYHKEKNSNNLYFHGGYTAGYTSRDEEVEQLKKDKQELLTMMPRLFTLLYRFARMYDLRREPDKVNAVLMHIYADLIADKTLSDADSLIKRMKGF